MRISSRLQIVNRNIAIEQGHLVCPDQLRDHPARPSIRPTSVILVKRSGRLGSEYSKHFYRPRSREIMYLVASVRQSTLSRLNRLTYNLYHSQVGIVGQGQRSRSRSNFWRTAVVLGARLCRVQQRAATPVTSLRRLSVFL